MHFSQRKEKKRKRKKKKNQEEIKKTRKREKRGEKKERPLPKIEHEHTNIVQDMPQAMSLHMRIDEALSLKVVVKKSQSPKHIHAVELSRFAEFGI